MEACGHFAWVRLLCFGANYQFFDTAVPVSNIERLEDVLQSKEIESYVNVDYDEDEDDEDDDDEDSDADDAIVKKCKEIFAEKKFVKVFLDDGNDPILAVGTVARVLKSMETAAKSSSAVQVE